MNSFQTRHTVSRLDATPFQQSVDPISPIADNDEWQGESRVITLAGRPFAPRTCTPGPRDEIFCGKENSCDVDSVCYSSCRYQRRLYPPPNRIG